MQIISLKDAFTHTLRLKNLIKRHNELLPILISKRLGKDIDSDNLKIDLQKKEISLINNNYKQDEVTLPFNPEVIFSSEYNSWIKNTVRM